MRQTIINGLGHALGTALTMAVFFITCLIVTAGLPVSDDLLRAVSLIAGWITYSLLVEGTQIEAYLGEREYNFDYLKYWNWQDTTVDVLIWNLCGGSIAGFQLMSVISALKDWLW